MVLQMLVKLIETVSIGQMVLTNHHLTKKSAKFVLKTNYLCAFIV